MLLGYGEFLIDTVVALALIVGGTILLGVVVHARGRGGPRHGPHSRTGACQSDREDQFASRRDAPG